MVVGDVRRVIEIPGDNAGVLDYAGSADKSKLLKLSHFLNDGAGSVGITQPPASHAIGLAEAVEDQDILVELGRAAKVAVVAIGAVNLVAQEQDAALLGQE